MNAVAEYRLVGWLRLLTEDCLGIPVFTDGSNTEFVPETDDRLHITVFHPCYIDGGYTIERRLPSEAAETVYAIGDNVPIPFAIGNQTRLADSAEASSTFVKKQGEARNSSVVKAVADILARSESGVYEYHKFMRQQSYSKDFAAVDLSLEKKQPSITIKNRKFAEVYKLCEEGRIAVRQKNFSSGLLAYVAALEMAGSEILTRNGFDEARIGACLTERSKVNKPKLRMHQIRHFATAATVMIYSLRSDRTEGRPYRSLNYRNLHVEEKKTLRNGKTYSQWQIIGLDNITRNWLNSVDRQPSATLLLQASRSEKIKTLQQVSFHIWRECAVGFADNNRLSILHKNNDFVFEQKLADGTTEKSSTPYAESWCLRLAYLLDFFWQALNTSSGLLVVKELEGMLVSCASLLLTDSYELVSSKAVL